jgi:hypothetical protein
LARFVLSVASMRKTLALTIALLASGATQARAVELRSELTIGREFVFLTNDLEVELLDGQLALGGGVTMVSDYVHERYGAQALIEYRGDHVAFGVAAAFGPRQERRGWASVDPHAEGQLTIGRWHLRGDGGVLMRRIDAAAGRMLLSLDQLQLHVAGDLTLDERWRGSFFGLYSFYGPDPSAAALRDLDLGLAVTLAGRPERWAVGGAVARRAARRLWLELGAAGVAYADGRGGAIVSRAVMRLGAWRGVTVGASFDVVVGVEAAAHEPRREIGGLELDYER